jgi:hypothetical protein
MRSIFILGILTLLGLGAISQHGGMTELALAQEAAPASQAMMLAAQEGDHGMMMMGKDKKGAAAQGQGNMSGCGMGGGMAMGDMKGDSKGGMMGGMMGGQSMKGCPMMTQMQQGKGMSGCCCANMGDKPAPKKPA